MKNTLIKIAMLGAVLATSLFADTQYYHTSVPGYTNSGQWNIYVPSSVSFSSRVESSFGGSATAYVIRTQSGGGLVYQVQVNGGVNYASASGQPAGSYQILHFVYTGTGYYASAQTTVSW